MTINVFLLKEMIETIITEELTPVSEAPLLSTPEPQISKAKKKALGGLGLDTGNMNPEDLENVLRLLVKRRYGRATLQRTDMEKLDKLTRWMQALPGGHQYRRGLAKYLRSKQDKVRKDPFRDFRQYRYDHVETVDESIDIFLKEMELPEEMFFHGTSVDLQPGEIILPPDQTGKISEKGRKKNLNKVFFTKDFGSAKIYAGRAFHSLGGTPVVYQVEPLGDIGTLNDAPGTTVFTAEGAKVLRKINID